MKKLSPRRGNLVVYVVSLAIVIVVMVMARNCTGATWHVHDNRAGGDTLNVAIEISPVGLSMRGDTLSGFYYDMVRIIASEHKRALKIDGFTNPESALERLERGRYDIVIGDLAANTQLRERFRATNPVLIDRQVLVQLKDSAGNLRYPTQLSLTNDTIHVPYNTPFKTRLEHLSRELGDTIYIAEKTDMGAEQLIILVAVGELPNAVVNSHLANIIGRDYPNLDSSVEISFSQFQSWLVNDKDSVLCDSLNVWIDEFLSSPTISSLQDKYFR